MKVQREQSGGRHGARRLERARLQAGASGGAMLMVESVMARTGLARSTIYAAVREGRFPAPIRLGRRCARWKAEAVDQWLAEQAGA